MMASRLRLPVVPVRLSGVDRIWHRAAKWPRFSLARATGGVEVRFGAPIDPDRKSWPAITAEVEEAVRRI
jgi:1-acyl-sn-glycerol-3-phosphate acyltransferase